MGDEGPCSTGWDIPIPAAQSTTSTMNTHLLFWPATFCLNAPLISKFIHYSAKFLSWTAMGVSNWSRRGFHCRGNWSNSPLVLLLLYNIIQRFSSKKFFYSNIIQRFSSQAPSKMVTKSSSLAQDTSNVFFLTATLQKLLTDNSLSGWCLPLMTIKHTHSRCAGQP